MKIAWHGSILPSHFEIGSLLRKKEEQWGLIIFLKQIHLQFGIVFPRLQSQSNMQWVNVLLS